MTAQPLLVEATTHLSEVSFCVVDLETTGGSEDSRITEFGAVRVKGGEVTGEFGTLVNPHTHIPAAIAVLTGITDSMVAGAPRLADVLPSFLEFAHGCVIVAHNARFDVGFLRRACAELGYAWPSPPVVDTVGLARSVMLRDEVPNHRLATLARHFRATVEPNHRALSDARATVDVLHALLERVGNLGVHTLEDLLECTRRVHPVRRARRTWAQGVPEKPGVYCFVAETQAHDGPRREVLYVGTSKNLRHRVRSYFTAAETRPRIDEMVRVATGVETTVCRTQLEAQVLELRLIAAHSPRYNRRSKFPEKASWVKVTTDAFPRFSLVSRVLDDGARYLGPFRRRAAAEEALLALYDACAMRRCTTRLSVRTPRAACAVAELGHCCAPCELGDGAAAYARVVETARTIFDGDVRAVVSAAEARLARLVVQERFEEAATVHRRLETFHDGMRRSHRVRTLAACPEIVAARRSGDGWEIHVVRYGRLAAAAVSGRGEDARGVAESAAAGAQYVSPPVPPLPAATVEETERIADWLESDGVRIIELTGDWSWPLHLGHRLGHLAAEDDRAAVECDEASRDLEVVALQRRGATLSRMRS
ncbi:MAG TPA: DEDD exonuclease domain-containing protein [Propionibacteriaceae bacterium]|nr:DEDD exonuclease domain-containing protein [Propionibacteriaceae bacterium]